MKTLIIPCGGKSTRYPGMKPKWLLTHPDGKLMVVKALEGLPLHAFDRIILTIVKAHAEQYEAPLILKQAFADRPDIEICQLDDFTRSVTETVYLTLRRMKVSRAFAIKDSDNFVAVDIPPEPLNAVVSYDIARDPSVPNICAKSFLVINREGVLENVAEKRVVSHLIAVGVYLFASTDLYDMAYAALAGWKGEAYISHIISYLIAQRGQSFVTLPARSYEDWGTLEEWKTVQQRSRTYFVDVDGVLLKNSGQYGRFNWTNNREVLLDNVQTLRELQRQGAQIVVVTARTEEYRQSLEELLRSAGLEPHAIIMGLHHAARVLINDFAPTNPYPSALAISLPRDGRLKDYL